MGLSRDIEKLRGVAEGSEPSEFARLLVTLLAANFDLAFDCLKTQKLLHRRRSSAWILEVEKEIRAWLPKASLKAKKKTHLMRHFAFSRAVQEILDLIDLKSNALNIWRAPTGVLLRSLFSFVEDHRERLESEVVARKGADGRLLYGFKGAEAERRELRDYCDWVGRIVNQISLVGVRESGDGTPSPNDIREALNFAGWTDLILVVLDCYTYKNFPVSVRGNEIDLRGIRSKTQQAMDWSTLREQSRNVVDSYVISRNIEETRKLASELLTASDSFEAFIDGEGAGIFQLLQPSRDQMARILKREVEKLVDLDFSLQISSSRFRVDELLEFWALLFQIAKCASLWRTECRKGGDPLLSRTKLSSLTVASLRCPALHAEGLLSQFLLNSAKRNQDPFFRPLIKIDDSTCLVASTFIETGRFARNLFTIAIREGRVDFSPKGLKPLKELGRLFAEAGYRVVVNFPLRDAQGPVTDVDIAAVIGSYLFVGQVKVLIHPDSAYDEWKVLVNLKRAAQQLTKSMLHVQSLRDRLGVPSGNLQTVPFLLTNVWHYTGSTVDGYRVVDFSYLENLLTGGEIWNVDLSREPTRHVVKLIDGKYPRGDELSRLILTPIHQKMFQVSRIEKRIVTIGDWKIRVPVEARDDVAQRKREVALARILAEKHV